MKVVWKALAAVVRSGAGAADVLVFRHPFAGMQLPKGTVEPGETLEAATLRELPEESGLILNTTPEHVGVWERIVGGGPEEDGPLEINRWSVSILWVDQALRDRWHHLAAGSPAEDGLTFEFSWLTLDENFSSSVHPLFTHVADMILGHVRARATSPPS